MMQLESHQGLKRKALKSGKIWTANTMVVKWIVWAHNLIYGVDRKPAICEEQNCLCS